MPSPNTPPHDAAADTLAKGPDVMPAGMAAVSLDLEIMRAQLVNAMHQACTFLRNANEGLDAFPVMGRVADFAVAFSVRTNQVGERVYLFKLENPDGSQASLHRVDGDNAPLEMDGFDAALSRAIGASLAGTVGVAYEHMVPAVVKPTHLAPSGLQ